MKDKVINIPTNKKKFFRQYVEVLKPIFNVGGRDGDVLAELLYQSYLRKDITDIKDKFKLVFDYDTKIKIQEDIGISSAMLHNCLTNLRKHKIIGDNNIINSKYLINPDENNISVKYNFVLKD